MDISPATTTTIPLKSNKEKLLTKKEFQEIDHAILIEDFEFLQKYVKATSNGKLRWVNFFKDPLLNVMLVYDSKDGILLQLIKMMTPDALETKNKVGDTALHVAAAKNRRVVVNALIEKNRNLIEKRNKNRETPLLKAAHFGSASTFDCLLSGSYISARNKYGSSVLHCAILGNNPALALKIAQQHQYLMITRNGRALTPLQLMVTIPEMFRSSLESGLVESLIYAIIPLNSHNESKKLGKKRDEEAAHKSRGSEQSKYWVEDDKDNAENDKFLKESKAKFSKKFLENCQPYLTEGAFQVRFFIILILKKLFKWVEKLEEQKIKHAQTIELIAYLARDSGYWDFIQHGMQRGRDIVERSMSFSNEIDDDDDSEDENPPFAVSHGYDNDDADNDGDEVAHRNAKVVPELPRWAESPLIIGAKMGLHDYVEQILKAYPQSAWIKDSKGRNFLQVAIKYGHVKIVKVITEIIKGPNPVIPSWLLSDIDSKNNTILHYAARTTIKGEGLALQMRHEIKWFEMVKKLLAKDMVYSRNINEKTAQELFDENHAEMVKSGRNQLMEIGKTCSGLLAAVVFATSFNIPGGVDSDNSTKNNMTKTEGNKFSSGSMGFKVFTHAYMIGGSSATCSLILFLSLLTSNYKPEAFRTSLPTKCFLAGAFFFCALMAFMVAFLSNAYLTIYGGGKPNTEDLLPLILELTGFPFLWAVVWFFGGFGPGFLDFISRMYPR